jgi:hypothetical protein
MKDGSIDGKVKSSLREVYEREIVTAEKRRSVAS